MIPSETMLPFYMRSYAEIHVPIIEADRMIEIGTNFKHNYKLKSPSGLFF